MVLDTENMIKKAISECIIEEMFRNLGFFVLKMGQEHTFNPITQLQEFIQVCGGKFKINRKFSQMNFLRTLPDFVIVDKEGISVFIEVKYRKNGYIDNKSVEYSEYNPSHLIVVSSEYNEKSLEGIQLDDSLKKEMLKTHFHMYMADDENYDGNRKMEFEVTTLLIWLQSNYDIKEDNVIQKYEKLVDKWLNPP